MIDYLRDPAAIYEASFAIIRAEASLSRFSKIEQTVATRIIHACGMTDVADDLRFSHGAVGAGIDALADGATVLCDVRMVRHGVIAGRMPAGNAIACPLDRDGIEVHAQEIGTTRTAAALDLARDEWGGAVVAVGNAPTALFHLLEAVAAGAPRPALVIGMPVGFVGAVESKDALMRSDLPFLAVRGRRGGSAMASAAVNALAGIAGTGR